MIKEPWYSVLVSKITIIVKWFASSADNSKDGPSGRKLTAITIMGLIVHGHLKYVDITNFYNILITYEIFVSVLLGIVTVEQLIKFFIDKKENKQE